MADAAVGNRVSSDEQHPVSRTIVLHLLPGVLLLAFYVAALPVVRDFGFPSLMAIFLAILFVLEPFQLGYLLYRARREGTTLGDVVPPRGRKIFRG